MGMVQYENSNHITITHLPNAFGTHQAILTPLVEQTSVAGNHSPERMRAGFQVYCPPR